MSSPLFLTLDERTRRELGVLSPSEGVAFSERAARLLQRTIRARRPRPVYDGATPADSDQLQRAALLAHEDTA